MRTPLNLRCSISHGILTKNEEVNIFVSTYADNMNNKCTGFSLLPALAFLFILFYHSN